MQTIDYMDNLRGFFLKRDFGEGSVDLREIILERIV